MIQGKLNKSKTKRNRKKNTAKLPPKTFLNSCVRSHFLGLINFANTMPNI